MELLLRKLRKRGSEYVISPSAELEYDYLSLYAGIDNLGLLKNVEKYLIELRFSLILN